MNFVRNGIYMVIRQHLGKMMNLMEILGNAGKFEMPFFTIIPK